MKSFENFVQRVARGSGLVGVIIGLIMMFGIVVDVSMRNLFNMPIPGMVEFMEYLLVADVFLCLAVAEVRKEHVTVDFLTDRLPKGPKWIISVVTRVIVIAVLVFLIVLTVRETVNSIQIGEFRYGEIHFPTWPARITQPIGMLAYLLAVASGLLVAIKTRSAGASKQETVV